MRRAIHDARLSTLRDAAALPVLVSQFLLFAPLPGCDGSKCMKVVDCFAPPDGCHYEGAHTQGDCSEQLTCGSIVCAQSDAGGSDSADNATVDFTMSEDATIGDANGPDALWSTSS